MQIIADVLIISIVVILASRLFLKFGVWFEKKSEGIVDKTKKEIEDGKND